MRNANQKTAEAVVLEANHISLCNATYTVILSNVQCKCTSRVRVSSYVNIQGCKVRVNNLGA